MLANFPSDSARFGTLSSDVHKPAEFLHELLDFIATELPRWRDRPDRKPETSETALTSQLCAHLNSAARHSDGWDVLQFGTEKPDEQQKGRKIDLVPTPCDATIWIDGRAYTDFDSLLPIECKRLPTPKGKDRDEREYVFSRCSTTGGMQRFKAGYHAGAHSLGAMIGYVQEETATFWISRVSKWISELESVEPGWSQKDSLQVERYDEQLRLAVLRSSHEREGGSTEIELHHLWLEMN